MNVLKNTAEARVHVEKREPFSAIILLCDAVEELAVCKRNVPVWEPSKGEESLREELLVQHAIMVNKYGIASEAAFYFAAAVDKLRPEWGFAGLCETARLLKNVLEKA